MPKIRISPAIANEFIGRAVFEQFHAAGYYNVSWHELKLLRADAEFNADAKSGPEHMPAGARLAYRGLAQQLKWLDQ